MYLITYHFPKKIKLLYLFAFKYPCIKRYCALFYEYDIFYMQNLDK